VESSSGVHQNTKINLPYYIEILLLGIYPKECTPKYGRGPCITMITATLFTTAKLWKQSTCPKTDEWIKKCVIYTQWSSI
jgi:hypothetical protein